MNPQIVMKRPDHIWIPCRMNSFDFNDLLTFSSAETINKRAKTIILFCSLQTVVDILTCRWRQQDSVICFKNY